MPKHISELTPDHLSHLEPKMAFFDIDGTLINSQNQLSDEVVQSLLKLKSKGVKLGLSSGRAYFAAKELIKTLGIDGPCCFFGGSMVVDPTSGKSLYSETLDEHTCKLLIELASAHDLALEFYTDESYHAAKPNQLHDLHAKYIGTEVKISDLNNLLASDKIYKAVIASKRSKEQKLSALLQENINSSIGFGYGMADPDVCFANIASINASRENAFDVITSYLGIKAANCLAFGDAQSDIPFLKLSGAGIAMDNASEEVKQSADFITSHVDKDGVVSFLKLLT